MKREVKRNVPHVKRQKLALGPAKPSAMGGWWVVILEKKAGAPYREANCIKKSSYSYEVLRC